GHPYRRADGTPYGVELDEAEAREAVTQSLEIEDRVAGAACRCLEAGPEETDSPYSPFASVAGELGYTGDPTLEPSPFFTSLAGYRRHHEQHV
ncbi:MBL fold metallo-hydrolase, partial [Streptomyces albogriseolus]